MAKDAAHMAGGTGRAAAHPFQKNIQAGRKAQVTRTKAMTKTKATQPGAQPSPPPPNFNF